MMGLNLRAALTALLVLTGCATQRTSCPEGWRQIGLRDYRQALARFDEALESSPSAELYGGRARALHLLNENRAAELAYGEAIQRDPREPQWHVGLALVRLARGDAAGAIEAGCAFWSTYAFMGGDGSARIWRRMQPPLMGGDLTHPTPAGADVMGAGIADALSWGYDQWRSGQRRGSEL